MDTKEGRRYYVIPQESVQACAESVNLEIDRSTAAILAEDVSYRLRDLINSSCRFMRHSFREKLSVNDVDKALKCADVSGIYGHANATEAGPFRATQGGRLWFIEDKELELSDVYEADEVYALRGPIHVKTDWLRVNGEEAQKTINKQNKVSPTKVSKSDSHGLSEEQLTYYDCLTKAVLGNNEHLRIIAYSELKQSHHLGPILPNLVSFIYAGIRRPHTDAEQLYRILLACRSLTSNQHIFLSPKPYLAMLTDSLRHCILEPLSFTNSSSIDHWAIREVAARVLAFLCRNWSNSVNNLEEINLQSLRKVLFDPLKSYSCHYGALFAISCFETKLIEQLVLPELSAYWPRLSRCLHDPHLPEMFADAHNVLGAILCSVEVCFLHRLNEFDRVAAMPAEEGDDGCSALLNNLSAIQKLSQYVQDLMSDSLYLRIPCTLRPNIYTPIERPVKIVQYKTGEELLREIEESESDSEEEMNESGNAGFEVEANVEGGIKLKIKKPKPKISQPKHVSISFAAKKAPPVVEVFDIETDLSRISVPVKMFVFLFAGVIQRSEYLTIRKPPSYDLHRKRHLSISYLQLHDRMSKITKRINTKRKAKFFTGNIANIL